MPEPKHHPQFFSNPEENAPQRLRLRITLHEPDELIRLTWTDSVDGIFQAEARVSYDGGSFSWWDVAWEIQRPGNAKPETRGSMLHRNSIRAQLNRLSKAFPVADADVSLASIPAAAGEGSSGGLPAGTGWPQEIGLWRWLEGRIFRMLETQRGRFEERLQAPPGPEDPKAIVSARKLRQLQNVFRAPAEPEESLQITLNSRHSLIELAWWVAGIPKPMGVLQIRCTGPEELTWELDEGGTLDTACSAIHPVAIRSQLLRFQSRYPIAESAISLRAVKSEPAHSKRPLSFQPLSWGPEKSPWFLLEEEIFAMGMELKSQFVGSEERLWPPDPGLASFLEREARREEKARREHEERLARVRESQQRQREEQRRKETERKARAMVEAAAKVSLPAPKPVIAIPEVPVRLEAANTEFQETLLPLQDLRGYFLRERAALWWVSNQSDDLLALPYCDIERLEYQIRTALRAIGPLRGRALLSDEVGLGKTIEAGLVLKEYLTRGMVKRFLVVTVPSLVDQWQEELSQKFRLPTATTNVVSARNDPEAFWKGNSGIVASLHTLKQPAHLAVAQTVQWDMLIIDEAHYLRNRTSQAWQAVNALPRQFLLLLTATPVQNSLEELYNLVTLLQPGQLPSPKEFRARFIDPKKPHQPREPEELRRLLGQVMIRNTRANAGIQLPPRRAETVLFTPDDAERAFWEQWEQEFRASLSTLNASQGNLWGRLLLQTAGSSPAAWLDALKSFPDRARAEAWSARAPLEASWQKKCRLLPPLTQGEGGVVIFTQFLQTQAALAAELRAASVPTFVINGQTPAPERQPITESFRREGGALLLSHSGTEGRNLQFSHRLVNFDLPWNPMEIEQRIGRLHRLGQQHPVRIYNLVQTGTLQEHLLQILQEKLNLFELVVGETGLILGERFSSDEFAEEVLRRWRESEGRVAEAMQSLGDELVAARRQYDEVKQLDDTLFAKDYESL